MAPISWKTGDWGPKANRLAIAEEAFLEALAHDAGSVRGPGHAGGVRTARTHGGRRFASRSWQRTLRKADAGLIQAEFQYLRSQGVHPQNNQAPKMSEAILGGFINGYFS